MGIIKDDSIQAVRDAIDIVDVIGSYIEVKKNQACCPFHGERTPSFHINKAKGYYKCFGCGASGDGIKFVMEYEKKDFYETIIHLADRYNIFLEYDKTAEIEPEKKQKKVELQKIIEAAGKRYFQSIFKMISEVSLSTFIDDKMRYLLNNRNLTFDSIIKFQIGFAPNEWRFLTDILVEKALLEPAKEIGLSQTKNGKNFDTFRNRIMIPIYDHNGILVGFGGRKLEDNNKDNPKYINSADSILYNKSKILFGLNHAIKPIKTFGFAFLVEGYFDVISMHQNGLENTVASSGTAFTDSQAKLLKKFTEKVVILYDGDKAGANATLKAIDVLFENGFTVEVVRLPEEQDPDTYIQKLTKELTQELQ